MTDTIKISRELRPLLERIAEFLNYAGERKPYPAKAYELRSELRALLSAQPSEPQKDAHELWLERPDLHPFPGGGVAQPSEPQGGEEVQVVAIAEGSGQLPERSWRGLRWAPGINPMDVPANSDLMTVSQHRRLMHERWVKVCSTLKERNDAREELEKHRRLMAEQLERERGLVAAMETLAAEYAKHAQIPCPDWVSASTVGRAIREALAAREKNHGK